MSVFTGLVLVSWKVDIRNLLSGRCRYCTWLGIGCTGRASSDEESVSLLTADGWKPVTLDGTL